MMSYLARRLVLLVLVASTVIINVMAPATANPLPTPFKSTNVSVAKNSQAKVIDLTPRQRQMIQAINQGRNREISKILNHSQQKKLVKLIRSGNTLNQAVEQLNLKSEKRDIIKAITQVYDLKMKALISSF